VAGKSAIGMVDGFELGRNFGGGHEGGNPQAVDRMDR
jgi:hypothetical protein